jgi:hypothetical protein
MKLREQIIQREAKKSVLFATFALASVFVGAALYMRMDFVSLIGEVIFLPLAAALLFIALINGLKVFFDKDTKNTASLLVAAFGIVLSLLAAGIMTFFIYHRIIYPPV